MKKYSSFFGSLLIIATFFVSCDYVNNAIPPSTAASGTTGSAGIDLSDSIISSNPSQRKAMVEDYTGHKCGNCPAAAQQLMSLEGTNLDKIVPIAVHAGYFAKVAGTYTTNFQTADGDAYDLTFGNSAAGNPNGLINRVGCQVAAGGIKQWSSWGTEVSNIIAIPAKFQIKIKYKYNTGSLLMNTSVTVKSLANNIGTYKIVVMLTEDSIIAEQLDYSLPVGSQFITNYRFNHVLRGTINSTWGDPIFTTGALLNTSETKTMNAFQINSNFKPSKCHVVAYIYDADAASSTKYEVLQAEEIKLK